MGAPEEPTHVQMQPPTASTAPLRKQSADVPGAERLLMVLTPTAPMIQKQKSNKKQREEAMQETGNQPEALKPQGRCLCLCEGQ